MWTCCCSQYESTFLNPMDRKNGGFMIGFLLLWIQYGNGIHAYIKVRAKLSTISALDVSSTLHCNGSKYLPTEIGVATCISMSSSSVFVITRPRWRKTARLQNNTQMKRETRKKLKYPVAFHRIGAEIAWWIRNITAIKKGGKEANAKRIILSFFSLKIPSKNLP